MERRRVSFTFRIVCIVATVLPVCGQIGVTICACQPSVYTFTFNFSATCDISTVEGPGVLDADCFARGFAIGSADDVNDTVPVQVTTVSIMELNKDLGVLAQTPYTDVFRDGDSFTYTSILSTPDNITGLTPDMIPGGLQLGIVGVNQLEEPITNVWIILFDNACGIFPVLEVGDQIGWTILSDLKEPMQSVCPLAPPPKLPTQSPTAVTSAPTRTPVALTSEQPSTAPTPIPSGVPTPSCPPIRTNIGNDTSAIGREPVSDANMPKQKGMKKQRIHNFYDPLQYDARGRGVGTNSPVLPPSECPEIAPSLPKEKGDAPVKESNTKPMINKKVKPKLEKKEKLFTKKYDAISNKDTNVDQYGTDDDDLSFVEITRPSTSPMKAPVILDESIRDSSFGSIQPSNAPTTIDQRLETHFKMIRDGWNKDKGAEAAKNPSSTTEKSKKASQFRR